MKIFLIGFMGAGKSSIGRLLSAHLDIPFFDQDQVIEGLSGSSVSSLFSDRGEVWFREYEAAVIRDFEYPESFVFSTGGGCPCYHDNMTWINLHGTSIYLSAKAEVLVSRLRSTKDSRPLINSLSGADFEKQITYRLALREPFYQMAAITVNMHAGESTEDVFTSVLRILKIN